MGEGDGEGVGGVGWVWGLAQAEEGLDHEGDLVLGAAAVGGDELLDFQGLVERDGEACVGSGEDGSGTGFADGDGGADVADDEVFDGDFGGMVHADDVGDGFVDAEEALGDGGGGGRGDGTEVDGGVAVALGEDEAVAGDGEAGVDAEDEGASQRIAFGETNKRMPGVASGVGSEVGGNRGVVGQSWKLCPYGRMGKGWGPSAAAWNSRGWITDERT
jgi:hypothetical protein